MVYDMIYEIYIGYNGDIRCIMVYDMMICIYIYDIIVYIYIWYKI